MTTAILRGKPISGNPHIRFDEGEVASARPSGGTLLYAKEVHHGMFGAVSSHICFGKVFGLCAVLLVLSAQAAYVVQDEPDQTAVWSNKGARGSLKTLDPFTDSNWQGGVAPTFTSATATNLVVDLSATANESGRLAELAAGVADRYYGPITLLHSFKDDTNTALYLQGLTGGAWTTVSAYWTSSGCPFVLRNGATYDGILDAKDGVRNNYVQYYLYPEAGATSTLNRVVVKGGPGVKVPSGSYGIVRELIGPGTFGVNDNATVDGASGTCVLPKKSDGTVEILCSPGPLTSLRVTDGRVVLHGHNDLPGPAGEPALRLDASCAESLTTTGAAACVVQWRDADGRTAHIANAAADGVHLPRLVADPTTGLKRVDFGGLLRTTNPQASEERWGPAAYLQLDRKIANACEIHVVFRDHFSGSPMPTLVGNGRDEWKRDWLREDEGCLFSNTSFCDAPVCFGSIRFNGQRTEAAAKPDTRRMLNVVSSSLSDGHLGSVYYIGAASVDVKNWQGGAEIAELIVYTNVLTETERLQTHRYLMSKWRPGEKVWDYERINLKKNAELNVADGVLSVRELALPAGVTTFVKRGEGTLELGSYPATLKEITVEAGDVAFSRSHTVISNPQLAAEATVHFDASRWEEDVEWFQDGDRKRVLRWNAYPRTNRNGDAYTMHTPMPFAGKYIVTNATVHLNASPTGLPMIDCGRDYRAYAADNKTVTNEATTLVFCCNGTEETVDDARHREGFLVYVKTHDSPTALSSMDWTIAKMKNGAGKFFLDDRYSLNSLVAGYWTLDGAWINPADCANGKDEVHVVAFRGARPMAINAFFEDRGSSPDGGGMVGEVVYYDRTLTPQERHDTELYLLRKWKNPSAAHPSDELLPDVLPRLVYTNPGRETSVKVDSGVSVKIPALDTTALSKGGKGTLTAVAQSERLQSLCVEGGCLRLLEAVAPGAAFHADATDIASITYTVDANGITNVSAWSGATALTSYNASPTRSPQLICADLNGLGVEMPLMDFGVEAKNSEPTLLASAASMTWPALGPLQEFYVVFQDVKAEAASGNHPQLIGTTENGETLNPLCTEPFHRQENQRAIATDWSSKALADGYTGMDGDKVSIRKEITDTNLHVYAFVATTAITNENFAFARRTTYRIGGARIGECIAFSGTNSVARRSAIENHLCAKWLGHDVPLVPNFWGLDEVELSDNGELAMSDGGMISVSTLEGNGRVSFGTLGGGISNTTSLVFEFRGKDDYDAITVDGDFAVVPSGKATVELNLTQPFRAKKLAGEYVVFAAKTLKNPENFANWTLSVVGAPKDLPVSFVYDPARGLVLRIFRHGLMLYVR